MTKATLNNQLWFYYDVFFPEFPQKRHLLEEREEKNLIFREISENERKKVLFVNVIRYEFMDFYQIPKQKFISIAC